MKKSLFLLAAIPLLAGCAHDRMDRSDAMRSEPYVASESSDRSFDRHAAGQPGENRAVRGIDTQSDDRVYQRDSLDDPALSDDPNVNTGAYEGEFPSATSDKFDQFPDNYTESGMNNWHRHRWMRGLW